MKSSANFDRGAICLYFLARIQNVCCRLELTGHGFTQNLKVWLYDVELDTTIRYVLLVLCLFVIVFKVGKVEKSRGPKKIGGLVKGIFVFREHVTCIK